MQWWLPEGKGGEEEGGRGARHSSRGGLGCEHPMEYAGVALKLYT